MKDAEWIADLVRHGLIKPSFVPPPEIRELRDLARLRRSLSEALATERNRTLKLLETANIKLASIAADAFGVSGLAMLHALVENTTSPKAMANLAKGRLRRKLQPLVLALTGRLTEHHRYLLAFHLHRLAAIEADISELDARIEEKSDLFRCNGRCCDAFRELTTASPSPSSQRSAPTCRCSATPLGSPPGQASAQATTKAQEDRKRTRLAEAMCISRLPW